MDRSAELARELAEVEEAIGALPEASAARRHLEVRRDSLRAEHAADVAETVDVQGSPRDAAPAAERWTVSSDRDGNGERTRFRTGWVIVAGLVLLGVVAGVAWFSSAYGRVPDVVNEDQGFASGALRSAGFTVDVSFESDPDVTEGQVLAQEPAPDSRFRTGEPVSLTVAERPSHDLDGFFALMAETAGPDDDCQGQGGYSDMRRGVTVTVRDGTGSTLATGSLGPGERMATSLCVFEVTVTGIPQSDFYAVEVGRRGELTYSHEEMQAQAWEVSLELGG